MSTIKTHIITTEWRNKSTLPKEGEEVEVKGSDFMGEWTARAVYRRVKKGKHGFGHRWVGMGFMGMRERPLDNSDVEAWRPIFEPKEAHHD